MTPTTIDLDTKRYGRLLANALPTVIKSEDENTRMLAIIEDLMAKGERNLTPEEDALLELLVDLVHDFEEQRYPLPSSPPHQMVAFLLEQRGLKASALWPVLGSKGRVSEVLSGKRGVSKEQARKLAAFFHVGVDLFI
ncbi:MAG: transcriptional regulator [Bryobacteraceae bacterium]|jgi:HTH-type transcriptional regulator/antitoxin HigA